MKLPETLRPPVALALVILACGDVATEPPQAPAGPGSGHPAIPGPGPKNPNEGGTVPAPRDGDPEPPWAPPVEAGDVAFPYTAYRCGYAVREVSPSRPAATFHDGGSAGEVPRNLHLTVAGNAASSVVVQWSTASPIKQTEVRFGDAPDKLDKIAHGFSFASGSRRQHELHLCGLRSGKTYYYDAGGEGARSKVHKFTTAPDAATEVTLLVAGDTRSDPTVLGDMAAAALAQGPTAMLLSGDAVATGSQQGQWDALFAAAPDLFAELPALWAHGNHEGLDELYFQQVALPDHNGGATQIEQWFATTYGPLRVVVLNDTVSSATQISGSERQFLEASLAAVDRARTPFVVTMHHKPMYTTSDGHSSDTQLRAQWGPLFAQYKVNVDIAGHVHSYESTHPIKAGTTTVTTEAAGGTRFFNFGGGGAGLYSFAANQPFIKTRESTHGFAIMKVNATTLTWAAFRETGSIIETLPIPKQ